MASPFATGPCDLFVAWAGLAAPVYLGASQRGPRFQVRRRFEPFYVDLGGSVSFDEIYGGTDALVSLDLVRFNWNVLTGIESAASPGGAFPFIDFAGEIGAMIGTENLGIGLWMRFNYATKPVFAANGMPRGLRFPLVKLLSEDWQDLAPPNPVKIPVVFHAQRLFDPSYISPLGYGSGKFGLCDNDLSLLPAGIN
jgi:hypothetical protein